MDEYLVIPLSLAQAIGNYLSQKPWSEVNQAMKALQELKTLEEVTLGTKDQSQES